MTYCIGVVVHEGMVFASDSRLHTASNDLAATCKMTVFERRGDRVIVLLSSGNLANAAAVIGIVNEGCAGGDPATDLWNARDIPDVTRMIANAMRAVEGREGHGPHELPFTASFIVGGQIGREPAQLFRIYPEGRVVEARVDRPYLQTGETKYGKPIVDRVITAVTPLADAAKCVLVSFDSTMRSDRSVGMPIDLVCYERDSLEVQMRRRFDAGDTYFSSLSGAWSRGAQRVCRQLPELRW